jgi:glyoxylase-like metal-dependent hydrolase (beta-lactamase superfamily II)
MGSRVKSVYCVFAVILIALIAVEGGHSKPRTITHKISDHIDLVECIDNGSVNVTVYKGSYGLLVVDAGYFQTRDQLYQAIIELDSNGVNTLIHTHSHGDHVGGNKPIGANATIIAHEKTAARMESQYGFLGGKTEVLVPKVTFTDSMVLDFNGEKIRLLHFPAAHTDGDLIVHFVNEKVVCMGDLLFADLLPFVHLSRGGTVYGYLDALKKVIDDFDDDITFIPGHKRPLSKAELKEYYNNFMLMVEAVESGMEDGKDFTQLLADSVLALWKDLSDPVYTTDSLLIRIIYDNKIYGGNPPKSIRDVLLAVVLEEGIDAALARYHEFKSEKAERYDFAEGELNNLGYTLMARDMIAEAEAVFKLNIEVYPNSANVYDSMGELYMVKGDKELAVKYYKKSLELNPDNSNAVNMLRKLKSD